MLEADELVADRVLLVEDNELSRRVGVRMLEALGFAVDVATDGADAVRSAQLRPYRAILMDCQMPVLDGYAAASAIRCNEGTSGRVPIIAVAAPSLIDDAASRACAGMDGYLAKPFTMAALADAIAAWAPATTGPTEPEPPVLDGAEPDAIGRWALEPAVIDRLERLGEATGEDLLNQLATLFLVDAMDHLTEMHGAVARADAESILRSAHTLFGASGSLGATGMARLCTTMGDAAAGARLDTCSSILMSLEAELERVRTALEARRSSTLPAVKP